MSAVQDVGLAFPWVRLSTQMYGWDIVNYNGANVRWRGTLGALAVSANAYAGSETEKDSAFQALYYTDGTRTDTRWSGIRGFEVQFGWEHMKLRAAGLRARNSNRYTYPDYPDEPQGFWTPAVPLRFYTLAFSAEPGPWLLQAESLYGNRKQEYGGDKGWMLTAGRRFGDLQLVFSRSAYKQIANPQETSVQIDTMNSAVLRWDVVPGRAWKLQLDDHRDHSPNQSLGSRQVLSIAYTGTF